MAQLHRFSVELWLSATEEQWHSGTGEQWQSEHWNSGTVAPGGSMEQWHTGTDGQ